MLLSYVAVLTVSTSRGRVREMADALGMSDKARDKTRKPEVQDVNKLSKSDLMSSTLLTINMIDMRKGVFMILVSFERIVLWYFNVNLIIEVIIFSSLSCNT